MVDHRVLITTSRQRGGRLCASWSSSVSQGDARWSAAVPVEVCPWKRDVWTLGDSGVGLRCAILLPSLGWEKKKKKDTFFFSCALLMNVEISGVWITEVLRIALMRRRRFCCLFLQI